MARGNKEAEWQSHANELDPEIDRSDSLSLPSRIPDIRNWFSSYQSPDYDVSDNFDAFDLLEEISRLRSGIAGELKKAKDRNFEQVEEQKRDPANKEHQKVQIIEKCPSSFSDRILPLSKCISIPPVEESRKKRKCSPEKGITKDAPKKFMEISPAKQDPTEGAEEGSDSEIEIGFISPNGTSNIYGKKSHILTSYSVENGNFFVNDGFISAKDREKPDSDGFISVKNKEKPEARDLTILIDDVELPTQRPWRETHKIINGESGRKFRKDQMNFSSQSRYVGDVDPLVGKEEKDGLPGGENRMELSEVSTFLEVLPASTGKWLCPRKNKPFRGPPMKQLRLERWIHPLH